VEALVFQIDQPRFRDGVAGVERHLDVAVVGERGVRDLADEDDILRVRMGAAIEVRPWLEQHEVGLRLATRRKR
jgi:hypothetical protein